MNREVIKANKEAFDWWLDGGELLGYFHEKGWLSLETPYWEDEILIVINDEHVEFRKALAEGKVIEYNDKGTMDIESNWVDISTKSDDVKSFRWHKNYYRIKPEEPRFKIGDWVILPNSGIKQLDIALLTLHNRAAVSNMKLWEPKEGDVVVCWDNDSYERHLAMIDTVKGNLCIPYGDNHTELMYFDNCIPYIGQSFEEMK